MINGQIRRDCAKEVLVRQTVNIAPTILCLEMAVALACGPAHPDDTASHAVDKRPATDDIDRARTWRRFWGAPP